MTEPKAGTGELQNFKKGQEVLVRGRIVDDELGDKLGVAIDTEEGQTKIRIASTMLRSLEGRPGRT